MSRAKVIFAFAFGQGEDGTPGRTNEALAAQITNLLPVYPLPVFAQWEIDDALQKRGTAVTYRAVPQNGYLSTRGVLAQFRQAWQNLYGGGQDTAVILIAHPDHQTRCRELLQEVGFQLILPAVSIDWQQFGCDKFGYDPDSTQPWTRNRAAFLRYESSVRLGIRKQEN